MKQEIVIEVQMKCEKCRTKAMRLAASTHGVNSVSLGGKDKTELIVIGDVDSVNLTNILRKKVGYAKIAQVKEKKEKKEEKEESYPVQLYPTPIVLYDRWASDNNSSCSIM
ncbi:hypothetical protein LUZ60_003280 [Juncus effusus]|nr:hypothetical protein LUZ60_003280 [Juncus effusus]